MRGAQSAVDLSSITRSIDVENRRRANSLTGLNDPDVARSRSEISFNTNVARMAHLPDLDPLLRPRRAWSTGSPLQAPAEEDAEAANGMQPLTPLLGVLRPAAGGAPPPTPGWRNMRKWMRPNAERGAIFNLCSATLGAGALSLPYAFREAGVGTAIILLLVCAGLTAFSIRLLLLARKHTGLTTYEDMASTLYSRCFALLLEINMLLFCFGCAVGYIVALSDLVEPFVRFFPATSLLPCKDWITIGVWAVVLLPLSLVKEVSSLQCTSTLGIVALAVLVVFVFGHMVLHLFDTGVSFRGLVEQIDWFHYSSLGVLNALPIMLFAFSCQLNVYSIQSELEVPTMARMSRIMKGAIAICLSVYLTIGVGGYIEFQTTTKGNILLNYDPAAEPVMLIPFLGITLTVLMAFPMNIFPCRYTLNELVFHVLPEMYAETKRVRHSAGKHRAVADDVAAAGELSFMYRYISRESC
jgi:amino acid permease